MLIEVFSDVVCPWCFIGKKRLDSVLSTEVGDGISVRWRPYQLYPNLPVDGVDRAQHLRHRYGDNADSARVPGRIAEEAGSVGLTLNFGDIERLPNTALAHRLLDAAWPSGHQHGLAEALFHAYFVEGVDVGDRDALSRIGEASGLSTPAIESAWADSDDELNTQRERAMDLNISGVPSFLLAERYVLPGAQTPEALAQILARAKERFDG